MSFSNYAMKLSPQRMLTSREAADYCRMSAVKFKRFCAVQPVEMPGGARLWDIHDLDQWIDSLKHGSIESDDDIISRLG